MKDLNILVIVVDQLRADCVGCFDNPQVKTPALDALAGDAVRFTDAYCAYPSCSASRYSLLSGLFAHQHGAYTNESTLVPTIPTFARMLRDSGFRTTAVGKMGFTPTYLDVGFDHLWLCEQFGDGRLDDDYHRDLVTANALDFDDLATHGGEYAGQFGALAKSFGAQASMLPDEVHSITWTGDQAMKELAAWSESPIDNLLLASFAKPGHPYTPSRRFLDMYDPTKLDLLPGWTDELAEHDAKFNSGPYAMGNLTEESMRSVLAHYYALVTQLDEQVGRMVDHLKKNGTYDDTLIIFTADHGDFMGCHHMIATEGFPYESLIRVPLMIKFPGNDDGGAARETLASLIDIAPTIVGMVDLAVPSSMTGLDLSDPDADRLMSFVQSGQSIFVARSPEYKLIRTVEREESYFFDLRDDPDELDNCIFKSTYRDIVDQHLQALADWILFHAPIHCHFDDEARCISQPNVPQSADHRERMLRYFNEKIAELDA